MSRVPGWVVSRAVTEGGELGGELWVHCQAGYRSAVAASLLQAAGRAVTAIDDEFGRAAEAGLPVVGEPVVGEPVVGEPVVREPWSGAGWVSGRGQSPGGLLRTSTVPL